LDIDPENPVDYPVLTNSTLDYVVFLVYNEDRTLNKKVKVQITWKVIREMGEQNVFNGTEAYKTGGYFCKTNKQNTALLDRLGM
jgi:hypothetical protein